MMFTKEDLKKLLIPLLLEQLLSVMVGMVDIMMVGAVGEAAVSGVSLVDAINLLIIQVFSAMATGGAVVISQYLGKERPENACMAANQLVLVSALLSLAITLLALAGNDFMISRVFGQIEEDVYQNARIYFYYTALSFPFLAVYNACAALYRSMGNSRVSMLTSLMMNAINIAGNSICIFILHMGVAGVAIPTLISRMAAAAVMLMLCRNQKNTVHIDRYFRLGFQPAMIKKILRIGIPNGMENGMFQLGKIMVQSLVSTMGTSATAAFAVASNLATLEYLPGNALSLGLITISGQCVGAGKYDQASYYTKLLVKLDYLMLAVICAVLVLFGGPITAVYGLSPETASITRNLITLHSFLMILWPPAFVMPYTFRASGDVKFTMYVSVLSMWIFRIGVSYLMVKVFGMDIYSVWIAMGIDWVCRLLFYTWRFASGKWKQHLIA